jgi:hypothetical protein
MYESIDINGTTYIKKTVGEMVTIIPINEGNIDYQIYLKSLDEAEAK